MPSNDARLLVDTLRLVAPANASVLATGWSRADTGALVRLAGHEGAGLWLHRRLKALGVAIGAAARDQLESAATRAVAQSLRVDAETTVSLDTLAAAGIPAIPLKAAAVRRLAARVPYADARAPTDVDLLVPAEAAPRAWNALVAIGYAAPKPVGPPDHHHLPPLVGATGVSVELHVTTVAAVAPAEAWRRATCDRASADFDGRACPVPGDAELLWHATAHAMVHIEDVGHVGLRLAQWLDAAALMAASTAIDWDRIRARLASPETPRPELARAWLHAAAGLAGRELAAAALGAHPVRPLRVERLLAWRLHVFARYAAGSRWTEKLIEEGARGEARLPPGPADAAASAYARTRHALASRAARVWWIVRR